MTRSESKQAMLDELGAVPVVADAFDPDQVAEAVGRARPEVIVYQLTAIGAVDLRHMDRDFAPTNRLRTEGIVLRYGWFHGPGTSLVPGGEQVELVRRRRFPPVGDGGGVVMMTELRGASNAKAKRELAWRPARPSWRQGFAAA
jgi:hypothetical protein